MSEPSSGRVLIVDDEPAVARACEAVLRRKSFEVVTARAIAEGVDLVKSGTFDAVLSDIKMPDGGGIDLLRAVRDHDPELPVILMTGEPAISSAVRAMTYGAFRYLIKPFGPNDLVDTVQRAVRLRKLALLKQAALELPSAATRDLSEFSELERTFERALELMWMAFQPIVAWGDRRVLGFEALLRSDAPELRNPGLFLDAGERLGRLHHLGRATRRLVAEAAEMAPADARLFINLHSHDLNDDELYDADSPLARHASRCVLEITERASLDVVRNLGARINDLKSLGYQIAVDDLGTGYAGLSCFTQLEPDIAKLDMSLVRNIDRDPRRRSIVRSMKTLCDELGVEVVTEGIETIEERDVLVDLGCDVLQGYLFARPNRGFGAPTWQ